MQQTTAPADPLPSSPPPPPPNVLRMSSRPVAALAQAWNRVVIVPKADEEAWEGTEIDVRRTVL